MDAIVHGGRTMTTTTAPLDHVHAIADDVHDDLLALVNDILDAHHAARPRSKAFGCDYTAPNGQPDGTWFIRDYDARSSESGCEVDYIKREHPDPENPRETDEEYLFGKYGWMSPNELVGEHQLFRQVVEEAVDRGYVEDSALDQCDSLFERLDDALQTAREAVSLDQIATLLENHETDMLRTLLATGDEEGRVIWSLLHSKDDDGEIIDNDVEVPVISESDDLMFVRAERYFYHKYREPDGKHYAYGAVIGLDDTPDVFFVHRLESDSDLRDPETEWTIGMVKEKMGFDMNFDEWVEAGKPHDVTVRAQGDLAFVRRDYRTKLWEHYETKYEAARQQLVSDQLPRRSRDDETALSERIESEFGDVDNVYVSTNRSLRVTAQPDSTDELKDLQKRVDIDEDIVREEQERQGIQRLTAKRRGEIIEDLISNRIIEWACNADGTTLDDIQAAADDSTRTQFEATDTQVNAVLGNHTVIVGPAREHPDDDYPQENECLMAVVVPDHANGVVWHDEHDVPDLDFPAGVYEFQFLRGYEDEWWMNN